MFLVPEKSEHKRFSSSRFTRMFPVFYFLVGFIYIFGRLDPLCYYQCQVPPFLWDGLFWKQFTAFPGGVMEYLSNFVSQFYYYSWSGALIILSCLVITFFLTRAILGQLFHGLKHSVYSYFPSILLLMMFSQYEHRLSPTLAWMFMSAFTLLYLKLQIKSTIGRFFCFLFLYLSLYYAAAGFALLFALLAILYEFLFKRNLVPGVFYVIIMMGIPYLAGATFFVMTMNSAYFYLLMPIYDYRPAGIPHLLYLYFPVLFITARVGILSRITGYTNRFPQKITFAVLTGLTILAALISFDSTMHTILKVDYYAHHRQWDKLLTFVEKHPSDDVLVAFHTNRALYHTGRMSSEMFSYNQQWGISGLFLPSEARKFFSIQVSDLYWDMGFLNEAQHWVLEDHTNFYHSPWHLQRLALISILKGNTPLAAMCLDALSKTILYGDWADRYKQYIHEPDYILENQQFGSLKNLQIDRDFIVNSAFPEQDILPLLAQDSNNRMAFEYLMAGYMLTFRLGLLTATLQTSDTFFSSALPRPYQEAVMVFMFQTRGETMESIGERVGIKTRAQFHDFMQILQLYYGNAWAARDELKKKYGHTYWYYSLFNNPTARKETS